MLAAGAAYVIANNATDMMNEYNYTADLISGSITGNGDDVYELADANGTVDIYGEIGVDGTGQPWEYTNSLTYRLPGGTPSVTHDLGRWASVSWGDALSTSAFTPGVYVN